MPEEASLITLNLSAHAMDSCSPNRDLPSSAREESPRGWSSYLASNSPRAWRCADLEKMRLFVVSAFFETPAATAAQGGWQCLPRHLTQAGRLGHVTYAKIRHMPGSWTARGSFQFRSRGGSSKLANNLAANSLRAWRCADMKHGRTDRTRSTKWVPRVPNTQAYARHPACASGDQK